MTAKREKKLDLNGFKIYWGQSFTAQILHVNKIEEAETTHASVPVGVFFQENSLNNNPKNTNFIVQCLQQHISNF